MELGKFLLGSAIAILAIVVAGVVESEIVTAVIPVSVGFLAILYGMALRNRLPRLAQIVEPLGIALVAGAFFAVAGFFMPVEFLWVPAICIALLCVLPLVVRLCPPT